MINIDLNFLNKELELAPIRTLFVQGENVADIIKINMPKMYNDIDLGSKVFVIKMLNRAGEYYEAVLPKNVSGESIVLEWTVTKEFTSVHGILKINVIALDDDGSVFSSKEGILEIQPAVMSSGIPITPETIFENYLSEMRMLAEASLESSETSQVILADMNSKIVNDVVTGGRDKVLSAEQGKILDGRINNIVGYAGTSTVEVVDARNAPERGTVFPTLKARLDAVDGDLNAHKAENANKHIAESGSNENGSYIKFDNGTMVCTGMITIQMGNSRGSANIVFPTTFSNTPKLCLNVRYVNGAESLEQDGIIANGTTSISGSNIYTSYYKNSIENYLLTFDYSAIGRWK